MPTLVTGATGFLGHHLVRALIQQGDAVRALVRPGTDVRHLCDLPVEIVRGDLLEPECVTAAMHEVDRVYHTAARVQINATNDSGMIQFNVEATRHVMEAAWQSGVDRLVYTSSVAAIGACDLHARLTEDDIYTGRGIRLPYASSKVAADRLVMQYARRGLPVVPVYPTLFMGPGDKYLNSTKPVLRYLEGRAVGYMAGGFGLCDVRDVAAGHMLAMQRGEPGRRYILGGENITLRQFYNLLQKVTTIRAPSIRFPAALAHVIAAITEWIEPIRGKPPLVTVGDVHNARHYWFYDYSRARNELGLACRPLVQCLRDTVDWLLPRVRSRSGRLPHPHFPTVSRHAEQPARQTAAP